MLKFLNTHFRFSLNAGQSPTHFNLVRYLREQGWHSSRFNWQAKFSDKNLQFNLQAAQCLEYKHLLARLIAHYCPDVMPLTYCINDKNWPIILGKIADEFNCSSESTSVWILKPALLNNGEAIKIFRNLADVENHFLGSARFGGEHVLQRYITNPHLLRPPAGHKYSIRMFVIFTNYAGVYLYPQGYFNVALHPFEENQFADLRSHLTNEHLHHDEANVVQIPAWRFDFFDKLYPSIKQITTITTKALQQQYPQAFIVEKEKTLAIFGFDFMVDSNQRVWLLEANHGPCFPISEDHPLQKYLYYDFWQAFIKAFVLPIASLSDTTNSEKLFDLIQGNFTWLERT
ncbi:YheC/YheD family protein [Legionella clemsonensis]|uniref:Tubulin-tyrosine ligase family protein n=1 Tax=Legionella clemsonensis TaxID=1867846 RepID=A0A222NZ10_9GAMM|nr:YheC/YheD family protein [Legionella clemsonensis]ASQ44816.1 Tubulin-tyrosine ligase family protein [Legionella clemsonensis]